MHSNHMHLNFYVCYGIKYKMLFAGGSADNSSDVGGVFTIAMYDLPSGSYWGDGSAKKYHI